MFQESFKSECFKKASGLNVSRKLQAWMFRDPGSGRPSLPPDSRPEPVSQDLWGLKLGGLELPSKLKVCLILRAPCLIDKCLQQNRFLKTPSWSMTMVSLQVWPKLEASKKLRGYQLRSIVWIIKYCTEAHIVPGFATQRQNVLIKDYHNSTWL